MSDDKKAPQATFRAPDGTGQESVSRCRWFTRWVLGHYPGARVRAPSGSRRGSRMPKIKRLYAAAWMAAGRGAPAPGSLKSFAKAQGWKKVHNQWVRL